MREPSGDQIGFLSFTPTLLVRFRMSPFSSGTDKISPRASNTARCPEGEISADSMRLPTLT